MVLLGKLRAAREEGRELKLSPEERQLLTTLVHCEKSNRTNPPELQWEAKRCGANQRLVDGMVRRGLARLIDADRVALTEAGIESLAEAEVDEKFAALSRYLSDGSEHLARGALVLIVREQAIRIAKLEARL